MTHIDGRRALHQYLLTFVKARAANPAAFPGAIRTGFYAWLRTQGHTIDAAMSAALNGFAWITPATLPEDFKDFTATNLPCDGETIHRFVLRYMYERFWDDRLLDDASIGLLVSGVTVVQAAEVMTEWDTWRAADPAYAGRTNRGRITEFRRTRANAGRLLTGEALATVAPGAGLDPVAWVIAELAAVRLAGGAGDRRLAKPEEGAACWKWALSAYGPQAATPSEVFDWLHAPLPAPGMADAHEPAGLAAITAGPLHAHRITLTAVKAALHVHGLAIRGAAYDEGWAANREKAARAAELNRQIYEALIGLAGMAVMPDSPYAICVEYNIADGVSWEHWWVEFGAPATATVVETFPTQVFEMYATALRQVNRMAPAQAAQYRVERIPVQSLLPMHREIIGARMMQFV